MIQQLRARLITILLFSLLVSPAAPTFARGGKATCPVWTTTDINFLNHAVEYGIYQFGDTIPNCNHCDLTQFEDTYVLSLPVDQLLINTTGVGDPDSFGDPNSLGGETYNETWLYAQNIDQTGLDSLQLYLVYTDPTTAAQNILIGKGIVYDSTTGDVEFRFPPDGLNGLTNIAPDEIQACIKDINTYDVPVNGPNK